MYPDTIIQYTSGTKLEIDFFLVPELSTLNAVQIAGKTNGETEAFARKKEQYASNIMNIMLANTIAISPNVTVSNVIQRISVVSFERSGSGDAQQADQLIGPAVFWILPCQHLSKRQNINKKLRKENPFSRLPGINRQYTYPAERQSAHSID